MIKFSGTKPDGRRFVGLCLSQGNWDKLLKGKPIVVQLREALGIDTDIEVLLIGGETEAKIADDLKEFIGPETKLRGVGD